MFAVCVLLAVGFSFCLAQNTSTEINLNETSYSYFAPMFGKCPDAYEHYCFFGTCRYLIPEDKPACICHNGYVGTRCESVNLLQIMSDNPHTTIAVVFSVTILVLLSLIFSVALGVYFCRPRKPISQLALLENTDV